ncbi:ABC transporter ATP-binding protein [Nakamurella aerolata]|uniref:ABC transporter ATP-binding protein n=1 Tax=Nakamurella aerolata TaxID=1656892 RepID=A0A849A5L1_9ACTN|nr:ABC transporter ATP-binding protein [Nakamurella aerolata]NNG34408.1 ABC transporter ATP-binding protein [Nakamurella aerolata]
MTQAVQVSGLRKTYTTKKVTTAAVDGVDLSINTGEIFALLGPNGAGKSTTVEILEGYRHRDAGEVSVLGEDPQTAGTRWRERIGIVLQNTKDLSLLTVRESLRTFSYYYPNARGADELMELVGLSGKADAKLTALSGGQRRRMDVALGIIGRPELLFLDEPTTGFDPEARRQFWDLIRQLRADGTTILLTTHYLDEAEALADRVGVINAGKVIEVNTPDRLGGRHGAEATVRYRDPSGELVSIGTNTPTETVRELMQRFDNAEIPELTVARPSLEDVYLKMIGVPAA